MRNKGISLIVLIISILVIIILSGAIILNVTKNNPIQNAKEAVFKSDLATIQEQLDIYAINETTKIMDLFDKENMNGKVSDFIPSLKKYDDELLVVNGKLQYIGNNTRRAELLAEIFGNNDTVVEVGGLKYNKPDLAYLAESTTRAIKWDNSNNESEIALSLAKNDTSWYDYSTKKWANIYTNNNGNKAYWVWIPRYAYKIYNPHTTTTQKINIKFLNGVSNVAADGSSLDGYTVHPAFTFGDKQLTGIWVAKYEASSSDPNRIETSGSSAGANLGGGNDTSLQVRILPNVYSWRNITVGNSQTVSMNMTSNSGSVGSNINVDTHLIKNVEWGAVAYLCQSQYGEEPWINPYGDVVDSSRKMKTGYSGTSKDNSMLTEGSVNLSQYNTVNGVKASTTGNIYGVYDMNGGAWERTASLINNGNVNIGTYGKSEHIESNKIKQDYIKYYDIYEPGDEEKENGPYYGTAGVTLWNAGRNESYNIIRKRLTDATYAKFALKKGDALWEVSNSTSYYGIYTTGQEASGNLRNWLIDTVRDASQGAQTSRGWSDDYMLIGYGSIPWLQRGGGAYSNNGAGIFGVYSDMGSPQSVYSFRPVLVVNN